MQPKYYAGGMGCRRYFRYGATMSRSLSAMLFMLSTVAALAQPLPAAIVTDPPPDRIHPPSLQVVHIPSHGLLINGVVYTAAGAGFHPTVVLLHGFPGNEQNLDLAQAIRRAGWNVLTLHYRGSWGSPGAFGFAHVFEDAQAALDFVRAPANAAKYAVDTHRLVVIGHSLGGMAAAIVGRDNASLLGVGLISAADFGAIGGGAVPGGRDGLTAFMSQSMESLAGTTPAALADEAMAHAKAWEFVAYAPGLSKHKLLLVTSDDGLASASDALARAVRKQGGKPVTEIHLATDHSYSGTRIALEAAVLRWLTSLP
jgi:pimeloyl-ACP methyl ester carboxylesterase